VQYTGERELPFICTVTEQKLTVEVHTVKLQLNYKAWTTEAISGCWKHLDLNILLSQHPVKCCYLSPRSMHLWKVCGGHHSPKDWFIQSITVMAFSRRSSYTIPACIQISACAEWDELRMHLNVLCLTDDTLSVVAVTDSKHSERKKIHFEWSKMNLERVMWCAYTQLRGMSGVGSYSNN